jgi:rhamnulokinase
VTARHPLRLLALDLGAESGRGIVGTFDGGSLALTEGHRFPNVPVRLGGTLYWDFPRLFGDVVTAIRRALAGGAIRSLGVDGWGVDFGLLDEFGRLIANPVHYRDRRTEGILEVAFRRMPRRELYDATGIQIMPINTLFQLLAMVEAGDPTLRHAGRLLMMPDLIGHFLTGRGVAEYTNASTTQCLDPVRRDWAHDLLGRFDIPTRILPEIVPPGTALGPLLPDVLASPAGAPVLVVAPGTHDTASAVAATPLDVNGRTAYLSSGTWSLLGLEVPDPVISEATLAANITNEGGVAGTIRLLKNVVGLWLVQEARRALWPDGEPPSYAELETQARNARPFTAFIDPDDERFLRPGDLPGAVRRYCDETGQPAPGDTPTLIRVLLESLALKYAMTVDELSAASGHPIDAIHVVGGGSSNELLCQLSADTTGLPVTAGPVEATAAGNLIVQAIAAGELGGIGEARELVTRSFPMRRYEPAGDPSEARARFSRVIRAQRERESRDAPAAART